MRRTVLFLIAGLYGLTALAQSPVIRARLEPAKNVIVGQPVRLTVTVLVPNYFTGSPQFPEFEIENAIVVLPQERAENSNEQIGGVAYAGITEVYSIYPQQPGDFQLPPAEVTVPYASAPPKTSVTHVPLPALTFHADVPAAARALDYFLPTTRLTMQQTWSSSLKNLQAGDSIERTITVTAVKMQAMLIPPLPVEAPDGIRIYPEEPDVKDQKTDRGEFVYGRRAQSAKYFIQKSGDYTLPAIELKWWNLSTNRVVTATLPAVHFVAVANPNGEVELPPEPEPVQAVQPKHISFWARYKFWIRAAILYGIPLVILSWIAWYFLPRFYRRMRARRRQRERSEPAYFHKLEQACRKNHAIAAYQWLLRWLSLAHPELTVPEFLSRAESPALATEAERLGASLFDLRSQNTSWKGKSLAHLLRQHRKSQVAIAPKQASLPNLNPNQQ